MSSNSFRMLSLAFFAISFSILAYFLFRAFIGLDDFFPVGENMVVIEFPPPPFPLYAKPITYFAFFFALGWMFGLEAIKDVVKEWPKNLITLIFILTGFFAYFMGYEILFNFMLWSTLISISSNNGKLEVNPDLLANSFPNPSMTWNLVFATKIFTVLFFVSIYTMYFLVSLKGK
ncbi:MAG: hypothetical protein ACE5GD_01610 [Candidatus Geothermarchaeales archaeon]